MQYSPIPRGSAPLPLADTWGHPGPPKIAPNQHYAAGARIGGTQWHPKSPRGRPKGPTWAPQGRFWEAREALSEGKFAIVAPCENPSIYYVFTTF